MKVETKFLNPSLKTFFIYLGVIFIPFLLIGLLVFVFTADPFEMYSWWIGLLLLPMGAAIGLTLGTRRLQLTIADTNSLEKSVDWSLEIFLNQGLQIKSRSKKEIILRSNRGFNKSFASWFGETWISISILKDKIEMEGPYTYLDGIDSKLRFGKIDFR